VSAGSSKADQTEALRREAAAKPLPSGFNLPLGAGLNVVGVLEDQFKVSSSKHTVLILPFLDETGKTVRAIYKCGAGSDLRQDQITLHILGILDRIWKGAGLEMSMSLYNVVSTGWNEGLIQCVEAETTASIQAGSLSKSNFIPSKSLAAFSEEALAQWLRGFNDTAELWDSCVDRFAHSCAAYCVATYVLGIADRHNDNIMLKSDGSLLHIDFGHVLGNIKYFGNIARETAPFHFTADMAFILGGEGSHTFQHFCELCATAYNHLRRHTRLFVTLFSLSLSTGLTELQNYEHVSYVLSTLSPELTEDEAARKFRGLILESLHCTTTVLNNGIHIARHYGV